MSCPVSAGLFLSLVLSSSWRGADVLFSSLSLSPSSFFSQARAKRYRRRIWRKRWGGKAQRKYEARVWRYWYRIWRYYVRRQVLVCSRPSTVQLYW